MEDFFTAAVKFQGTSLIKTRYKLAIYFFNWIQLKLTVIPVHSLCQS